MNTDSKLNNKIFKQAIIGVLLFIGAILFSVSNLGMFQTMQVPYLSITAILGTGSLFLLGKSIRDDKYRYD